MIISIVAFGIGVVGGLGGTGFAAKVNEAIKNKITTGRNLMSRK